MRASFSPSPRILCPAHSSFSFHIIFIWINRYFLTYALACTYPCTILIRNVAPYIFQGMRCEMSEAEIMKSRYNVENVFVSLYKRVLITSWLLLWSLHLYIFGIISGCGYSIFPAIQLRQVKFNIIEFKNWDMIWNEYSLLWYFKTTN